MTVNPEAFIVLKSTNSFDSLVFHLSSNTQGGEEDEGEDAVAVDSEGELEDEGNAAYSAEVVDDSDEEAEVVMPPKKKSKKGSQWESL